jgi:ribosomal protein S18 acetylase RimI-like enzyme
MSIQIRLIRAADLAAVMALQDSCYSNNLYEPPELLVRRLAAAPESCWLAESPAGELLAYLFCYPSLAGKVTPLGSPFQVASKPELLYLHDMAVSTKARGLGLASRLLQQAEDFACQYSLSRLALVAVQGSVGYWQRQGFIVQDQPTAEAQAALNSYRGEQARYMMKAF